MKYQDKISKAHKVLNYLKTGMSENEAINLLKSKGLSNLDISSIMASSRNIFYDKFGKAENFNIEKLKAKELKAANSEWLVKYNQHILRKHKETEEYKFNKLLNKNATKKEIESNIDTNTISKETINKRLKDISTSNKKRNRDGYVGFIRGLGMLFFYELTILKERPIHFLLITGLYFMARGAYSIFKSKKR